MRTGLPASGGADAAGAIGRPGTMGGRMDALPTPALVVDLDVLDANLQAMQARCDAAAVALRPHVKGHGSAWIAARQLRAGASGLAAATLEEATGLLRAGLGSDVLLTSVVSGRSAIAIAALQQLGDLAVVADDPGFAAALDEAAGAAGVSVRVLVDVDIGQHRGGATGPERAVAVADAVGAAPNLLLAGVQAYEGHLQLVGAQERRGGHAAAMAALRACLDALGAAGHRPALVTSAGTGTVPLALEAGLVTEVQPGSYALMDASYAAAGAAGFGQAAHVLATVRSVTGPGEVVVDAGLKALSVDSGPAVVDGLEATYVPAGDEHGAIRGEVASLRPGDRVRLIPSHTDTTVRLHRVLWVLRGAGAPVALPLF
jgi:D-serine deaminase-like pyridoxal phosphate-dependent protein